MQSSIQNWLMLLHQNHSISFFNVDFIFLKIENSWINLYLKYEPNNQSYINRKESIFLVFSSYFKMIDFKIVHIELQN